MTNTDDGPDNTQLNTIQPKSSNTVIGILLASAFAVILNETVIGVAMPSIMADFNVSASTAQWLATVAMLTVAVVIPTTGFILERWSLRAVFSVAMSVFLVGTVVAGFAPSFGVLLVARVVQSVGSALLMPLLITTVMRTVDPTRRGSVMGRVSLIIAVAPAMGPTFAGLIMQNYSWRAVFLCLLPIVGVCGVLGTYLLRAENQSDPSVKFDALSLVLSAITFSSLIYGISSLGTAVVSDSTVLIPLGFIIVGAAALILFAKRQAYLIRTPGDDAFLDLRVLKSKQYRNSLLLMLLTMSIFYGVIILLPLYVQQVHGEQPMTAGMITLPGTLIMGFLGPVVGRIFDKHGPRKLVITGTFLYTLGFLIMAVFFTPRVSLWVIVATWIVVATGLALVTTPLNLNALEAVPADLYSHGSAILSTTTRLAGALGTAVFLTVMSVVAQVYTEKGRSGWGESAGTILSPEAQAMGYGTHIAFILAFLLGVLACISVFVLRLKDPADSGTVAESAVTREGS